MGLWALLNAASVQHQCMHQSIINASSLHHQCIHYHQCIINASSMHSLTSMHHQCIINAASMHHQCIINAASMHHQCISNASSMHAQCMLILALIQSFGRARLPCAPHSSYTRSPTFCFHDARSEMGEVKWACQQKERHNAPPRSRRNSGNNSAPAAPHQTSSATSPSPNIGHIAPPPSLPHRAHRPPSPPPSVAICSLNHPTLRYFAFVSAAASLLFLLLPLLSAVPPL